MRNVESSEFSLNIFYSEVLVHSLRSDWLLIWNWLFIYFHFFPLYNYSRPAPTKDNLCYSSKVFEFDNVYFIKLGWQNWIKRPQQEKRRSKAAAAAHIFLERTVWVYLVINDIKFLSFKDIRFWTDLA